MLLGFAMQEVDTLESLIIHKKRVWIHKNNTSQIHIYIC